MKLRDSFLYLVKGGIIGISCLIPGISGGSVAISLGVYDSFINNIWQIMKRKRNAIYIIIIPLIIGLLGGLFGGSHLVSLLLTKYKLQTIFLFIGLLCGGYRLTITKAKLKLNIKSLSLFLISFIFILLIDLLVINNFIINSSNSLLNSFFVGLLSGIIFLIPGISTSSVLLFFAKYNYILNSFTELFNIKSILIITILIIGAILGILIFSKIISYFLKNYKTISYTIISGFVMASIVILILEINKITFNFATICTTILAFLWGYILSKNYEKE